MDKGIFTLSVPNNSCLLLLWLVGLVENNYSCKYLDWKGPPFHSSSFSFLGVVLGVKSRTLTWNTEGSFTPSALLFGWRFLSVCVLDGVLEHCKSFISFFHSLLCQPLENFWGTYLNHCVNIHLYMKKCTKTLCLNIPCERRLHFRGMSWRVKSS